MQNNILSLPSLNPCTGCAICASSCPHHAIQMVLSSQGYYRPIIEEHLCTGCGLCVKYCYKYDDFVHEPVSRDPQCYSAINKSKFELKTSTSGGVSVELMKECLRQGYKVLGAAYDCAKNIAITKIADNEAALEQFKGSKYFQSDTKTAFDAIIQSNEKFAIFATPCQVYALNNYAIQRNCRNRFVFIDFFCHGCPSINLWKKYLEQTKKEHGVSTFDQIRFRSKTHGWHEYCFTFSKNNIDYNSSRIMDPFHELFFDMQIMNEACYHCVPRSSIEYTDIRLGDFWGYQYDTNITGVSGVVPVTEKGQNLFDAVKLKFDTKPHAFQEVIAGQSYGKQHDYDASKREYALALLSSALDMNAIFKKYRKTYSPKQRLKQTAKRLAKRMPTKLYIKIRQTLHQ